MSGKKTLKPESQTEWRFPLDEKRKAQSLSMIRQETQQKRIMQRPAFAENVWNQLRFQSWKQWAAQGSVLLAAVFLICQFVENGYTGTDSIAACSVFLVFAGNICLSGIAHLFSWHMAELEKTLYLDLRQMVCIQMLEAGTIDLLILALLTGFVGGKSEAGIFAYLLYLLVPFLWSDILYLHMLTFFRSVYSSLKQLSMGALCGGLALFPACLKNAYAPKYIPVWGILTAAGFLFLLAEIYTILGKIDGGENICLN